MYQFIDDLDVICCVEIGVFILCGYYLWLIEWLEQNILLLVLLFGLGFELYMFVYYCYICDQVFVWMCVEVVECGYDGIELCVSYYNSGVV